MKQILIRPVVLLLLGLLSSSVLQAATIPDFNFSWRFQLGDCKNCAQIDYRDNDWQQIDLPHDWSIKDRYKVKSADGKLQPSPFNAESVNHYDTGYTDGGIGWYRKHLHLNQPKQTAILAFDGVYMDATVFVNGHKIAEHYYGYSPFYVDISEQLNFNGDNLLAVRVNNPNKNSRWYSGSGIYRQVELQLLPENHINFYGPQIISTPVSEQSASIQVRTEVKFKVPASGLSLHNQILNADGKLVAETQTQAIASGDLSEMQLTLANPKRWSPESPYLYQLKQTLRQGDNILETRLTPFGVRSIEFNADKGFLLNGQPLLLKGMNLHHDNYLLGAEAHPKAEWRKIARIKAAGYNAIRLSHNPPSSALLEAADHLGILVIDEAFDAWNEHKSDNINDYSAHFKQDWQRDVAAMITRDRNHPSIIMWSLGNEIPEQGKPLGAETAKQLVAFARTLDASRPFTSGANISGSQGDAYLNQFDVVGYNYQNHNYLSDRQRNPQRIMYGSETYSREAFSYWQFVEQQPYIIGDFVWTGWDYIGEAGIGWTGYGSDWYGIGPYPWTLAYCGEIDVLGNKRPSAYFRDVLWQTGNADISAFVKSPVPSLAPDQEPDRKLYWTQPDLHPSWTWPGFEQQPLEVIVYSRYPQVELLLNGVSLGKKVVSSASQFQVTYQVPYQPGELQAIGYDAAGKASAPWVLRTSAKAKRVLVMPESQQLQADGEDLLYLNLQLVDKQGQPVYWWQYDQQISVKVTGAAKLYALGNGDPRSVESFAGPSRRSFQGKALAVLRSLKGKTGTINIEVSGPGLRTTKLKLRAD